MDMYVPHSSNCFDLMGFDILIDDELKPWLIEVNMSPSMGCDSKIDTEIKAPLVADLLSMLGFVNNSFRA
jgi:tubulin polyglutamylase TTLL5